jgi:hypothetical protein
MYLKFTPSAATLVPQSSKLKCCRAMQLVHKHIGRVARYKPVISVAKSFLDGSTGGVTGDAASRYPEQPAGKLGTVRYYPAENGCI